VAIFGAESLVDESVEGLCAQRRLAAGTQIHQFFNDVASGCAV